MTLLVLLCGACGDSASKAGEACSTAGDCDDTLVCALTSEDASDYVCADFRDTYPETNCSPGADPTMPCDVVLKKGAGEACLKASQCLSGSCLANADGGTGALCD